MNARQRAALTRATAHHVGDRAEFERLEAAARAAAPPYYPERTTEIRLGRNYVRAGDTVRVLPSRPGKRDGFLARFVGAKLDTATGEVRWVEVVGGPRGRSMVRSLRLDRIERVAQTRNGERVR